uniref:Mitochondrial fission regulator n=1 Tax=Oncorhynchus tshawytscha TaxID=74940 RepID=A0AAZ3QWA8_ONCTS
MSLLEDIFDLLQNVLEYFGVSPDMLIPVWESQLCGQYRSLVRMIDQPPIDPVSTYPLPGQYECKLHRYLDVTMDTLPAIPSLADVLWVAEDEGERFTKIRVGTSPLSKKLVVLAPPRPGDPGLAAVRAQPGDMMLGHRSDPVALRKITALEDELLKLRAQIAMIVTAPPSEPSRYPGMSPASVLTSTPCRPPPPPCPPPPPPCPPPPSSSVGLSAVENLIQQGREAGKGHAQGRAMRLGRLDYYSPRIRRSPGGTPVRRRRSKGAALLSDPASMIAEALRRKFAHRRLDDSYDKENRSVELSPFGSPDTSPCVSTEPRLQTVTQAVRRDRPRL